MLRHGGGPGVADRVAREVVRLPRHPLRGGTGRKDAPTRELALARPWQPGKAVGTEPASRPQRAITCRLAWEAPTGSL